jgi:hypothetical protein
VSLSLRSVQSIARRAAEHLGQEEVENKKTKKTTKKKKTTKRPLAYTPLSECHGVKESFYAVVLGIPPPVSDSTLGGKPAGSAHQGSGWWP